MFADMMEFGNETGRQVIANNTTDYHPMMRWGGSGTGSFFWIHVFLATATWILVIVVLIALARWLWKKGDKVK